MLCVIPAAGRGVRFNELGKNYPKRVLPYKEKPIIAHNISLAFVPVDLMVYLLWVPLGLLDDQGVLDGIHFVEVSGVVNSPVLQILLECAEICNPDLLGF